MAQMLSIPSVAVRPILFKFTATLPVVTIHTVAIAQGSPKEEAEK